MLNFLSPDKAGWSPRWKAALRVYYDLGLMLISVEHDGTIGWDELQDIKDDIAGPSAIAIEVYPPADRVVNNIAMRHLWLLGPDDFWPDLCREGKPELTTLRDRYLAARLTAGATT